MINGKRFEDFESDDSKRYKSRLLLWLLEGILAEKGELTPQDYQNAYDKCMVLIQEDHELISKILRKSGDHSVNIPKSCLSQLGHAGAVKRDAVELANYMKTYVVLRLSDQPKNKRLEIYNYLTMVCGFRARAQEAIPSGDKLNFFGVFQLLGVEMFFFDEEMSGENFKLKPALERFLSEQGQRIVLKRKNYYDFSSLGYDECQICTSCWVKESDIKFLACFKTLEQLESFLALSFRRTFYAELRNSLMDMDIDSFFSDEGKMNLGD